MNATLLLEALLWSVIWMLFVAVSVRVFPFTIEHDYPEEVRRVAKLQKPSPKQRWQGAAWGAVGLTILFGLLVIFAVTRFAGQIPSFWSVFAYLWVICMAWNLVDLILVDWLLICTLSVRCFVLPGTEQCEANKDYAFHFIGFLKGCVAMTIVALLFSGVSYGIIRCLM